ncbi:Lrp/AsnC family transcriptional regulator [Aestuariispira insulae]|uniref:AsnC family transcriptional regulator n=1 Tax=Aestuariispira insulae TaxID=1461337 RepID=A0A3D9HPN1_9PROT|nr:Lrp/AsnC family transcriptional regulator [Aestuariispira insulae]RED51474.1 AsnC family transcriptional regulator [Aestuariispira insulae]
MDDIDKRIINALQRDGRLSYRALAAIVGLSTPAVSERVRRLEDLGIIQGYTVQIDRRKLGWSLTAFVRLICPQDHYQAVYRLARDQREILECHHVTGEDCFVIKLMARDVAHLEQVIERFHGIGRSISSLVLSTAQEDKPVSPV